MNNLQMCVCVCKFKQLLQQRKQSQCNQLSCHQIMILG